jgi:hypothetical protein
VFVFFIEKRETKSIARLKFMEIVPEQQHTTQGEKKWL